MGSLLGLAKTDYFSGIQKNRTCTAGGQRDRCVCVQGGGHQERTLGGILRHSTRDRGAETRESRETGRPGPNGEKWVPESQEQRNGLETQEDCQGSRRETQTDGEGTAGRAKKCPWASGGAWAG